MINTSNLSESYGSDDEVKQLFGSYYHELNSAVEHLSNQQHETLNIIITKAIKKLGIQLDEPNHKIPRALFRFMITTALDYENPLVLEYFSGVLCAAYREIGHDDRATQIAHTISRLSHYQLRTHYIIYSCYIKLFKGQTHNIYDIRERENLLFFLPYANYFSSMPMTTQEKNNLRSMIHYIFFGLKGENLIGDHLLYGNGDYLNEHFGSQKTPITTNGLLIAPSINGIDLYLHAMGFGNRSANALLEPKFPSFDVDIKINYNGVHYVKH